MGHESDLRVRGEWEVRGHGAAQPGLCEGCGHTHLRWTSGISFKKIIIKKGPVSHVECAATRINFF